MEKIALVTDSTADLTPAMKTEYKAHVMPLKILFGEQEYLDGELTSEEFYLRLASARELPRSSQPAPEDFIRLYREILTKYDEIISIHLSTALSGTVNAARLAAESLQAKIHVVDSKNISLGIGLMVAEAAQGIMAGLESIQVLEQIQRARRNIETMFTLNTLEYLQKGGRIGRVQGMVGSLLNIKPVIRVNDEGVYVPAGKARSQDKALEQIVKSLTELAGERKAKTLAIAHGAALEAANRLKESLENAFDIPATIITQVGAVIGVHTGPGTVGAAVQFE